MDYDNTDIPNVDYEVQNEDILDTTVKINPTFYIHVAILRAQQILANPNITDSLTNYVIMVEHIQSLCKAAKFIDEKYELDVTAFKVEQDKDISSSSVKAARLANKKLELLTESFFKSAPISAPLKYVIGRKPKAEEEKKAETPPAEPELTEPTIT